MRAITILSFCCCALFADDQRTADQARRAYDAEISAVITEAQADLEAKREAFAEEIAAIRTAAETAGDDEALEAADEAIAVDDDVIRVEPRRSLWVSDEGFFERLHEGHWIEKTPNGDANVFDESTRTADYVELSRSNAIVRLFDDKCDVRLLPAREFRTFYRGSWE